MQHPGSSKNTKQKDTEKMWDLFCGIIKVRCPKVPIYSLYLVCGYSYYLMVLFIACTIHH